MAPLNWSGARVEAGRREATPISKLLEGTFAIEGDKATPKCNAESLKKFQRVVEQHPAFPFSHYALAACLRERGDAAWRVHATAAVVILEQTTAIANHHKNHDQILAKLRGWLAKGPTRKAPQ